MKLNILKMSLPAVLLCFAGPSLADPATSTMASMSKPGATTAMAKVSNELGQKVQAKLMADKRLQTARIETDVTAQGSVLLRGTVDNMQQSQIAEQLASTVTGVNKVRNELTVPKGE